MITGAIVLAAGLSRRMGAAKLTLPVGGVPMLARTLAAVQAAIFAFPYDFGAVTKIAALREQELDADRIVNTWERDRLLAWAAVGGRG